MNKQEHLLTIVGEECTEVHQRCSKALRFGMDEVQTDQTLSNKDRIIQEFNDLIAAMELLFDCNSVDLISEDKIISKKNKILKYLSYSIECGTLEQSEKNKDMEFSVPSYSPFNTKICDFCSETETDGHAEWCPEYGQ